MRRDDKRQELIARIPAWYSGPIHFLLLNIVLLAAIGLSLFLVDGPRWWEWLAIPAFFVFANGFEWWIHQGPMHHRTGWAPWLYRRHSTEHHVVFTDTTMSLQSNRDLWYVLFPPWIPPLMLLLNLPIPLLLFWTGHWNLALLFYIATVSYYLVYEWFHLLHHYPADTWIGRRRWVAVLRQHHLDHHRPAVMAKGNFNISFPLWDRLLGTWITPKEKG